VWICCTTSCTTNPQQIHVVEFGFKVAAKYAENITVLVLRESDLHWSPSQSIFGGVKVRLG